jgi:hypothetical protein
MHSLQVESTESQFPIGPTLCGGSAHETEILESFGFVGGPILDPIAAPQQDQTEETGEEELSNEDLDEP